MKDEMKNGKTSNVSTVIRKENLRVTCIERKYKVSNSKIGFIVTAKKELDENTTNELLHEDMELKTFLANYEITDVVPMSICQEVSNVTGKNSPTVKIPTRNIMTKKNGVPTRGDDIRERNDHAQIRNGDICTKCNDEQMENLSTCKTAQNEAVKRRELLDSLDLPERFVVKDYKKALEKKGIVITNTAMPYDDLDCLRKQGKIVRMEKGEHGVVTFMKKKNEAKNEAEIVT